MTRPEEIVRDINRPNPDRAHVFEEVRQELQGGPRASRQALNRINQDAMFQNIGLPSDSQLLGTLANQYEVRRQGQVQYIDAQTGRVNRTAEVHQINTNMSRQFIERPDGSSYYTTQRGDTLSQIAEAALIDRLGRRPSGREIYNFVPQIEAANQMRPGQVFHGGETLLIPHSDRPLNGRTAPEQPATRPAEQPIPPRPGEPAARIPNEASLGANVIPGLPSGRVGQAVSGEGVTGSRQVRDTRNPDGHTYDYTGTLAEGRMYGFRTSFTAQERTNANGEVTQRNVQYNTSNLFSGSGITLPLETANGRVELNNVNRVRSERNRDGRWETTFYTNSGQRHAITDRNGVVRFID